MKNIIILSVLCHFLFGCSVYMANSGDSKRDLDVLAAGTSRDIVLAELGTPASSIDTVTAEGQKERYDIFSFVQGRSKGSNVGRSLVYGTAAVFTLGLSEVVAAPLEHAVGDAGKIRLRVNYDNEWQVSDAKVYDKDEWVTMEELNKRVKARQQAEDQKAAYGS